MDRVRKGAEHQDDKRAGKKCWLEDPGFLGRHGSNSDPSEQLFSVRGGDVCR